VASDADRIVDVYRRNARAWAKERSDQGLFEAAWLDRFCSLIPAGAAVLDIGCGAAVPLAGYLIESGYDVTGADAAPEMIDMCCTRFPGQKWHVADMRTLALNRVFDGLLAWDSFFHLRHDDQRRMFPVFRKHAAPRAALMFTSGPSHGEAIGTLGGEALYHASLDPAEYRELLDESGFETVAQLIADPDHGRRIVWLAQLR
jgi:SAM-dependent methyltransferase